MTYIELCMLSIEPIPYFEMRKPDQMTKIEKGNNNNNNNNNNDDNDDDDDNNNNVKPKLRKGLWSPEEDEKLMNYMLRNGQGCWTDIARNAGLQRCGKSCRLRWINYLRPDLKRGAFSILRRRTHSSSAFYSWQQFACQLIKFRWSQIAARLPGRTDNEIKNFWNSTVKKMLKNNNVSSTNSPNNSNSSEPTDALAGGILSFQEHELMNMYMDYSTTSSSSMQTTGNYHFDPFPIDNTHIIPSTTGLYNVPTQGGMVDGHLGDYGILEPYMMGLENELSIPALENRVVDGSNCVVEFMFDKNANGNNFVNSECIKVEDVIDFGNQWEEGENLRMGELDWEGLLSTVTSSPFLGSQVK